MDLEGESDYNCVSMAGHSSNPFSSSRCPWLHLLQVPLRHIARARRDVPSRTRRAMRKGVCTRTIHGWCGEGDGFITGRFDSPCSGALHTLRSVSVPQKWLTSLASRAFPYFAKPPNSRFNLRFTSTIGCVKDSRNIQALG